MGMFDSDTTSTTANEEIEWKDFVDEELRAPENALLNEYGSNKDIQKALVHNKKLASSSIRLPKEGADEDEVAKFWRKLDAPESADGYEFTLNDELKPLMAEDVLNEIREVGFANHVPKKMLANVVEGIASKRRVAAQKFIEEINGTLESYKQIEAKIFGDDAGKVDERVKKFVASSNLIDDVLRQAISSDPRLNSHPAIKAAFNALAKAENADAIDPDAVKRNTGSGNKEALLAEKARIKADPEYIRDPAGPHGKHNRLIAINQALADFE